MGIFSNPSFSFLFFRTVFGLAKNNAEQQKIIFTCRFYFVLFCILSRIAVYSKIIRTSIYLEESVTTRSTDILYNKSDNCNMFQSVRLQPLPVVSCDSDSFKRTNETFKSFKKTKGIDGMGTTTDYEECIHIRMIALLKKLMV